MHTDDLDEGWPGERIDFPLRLASTALVIIDMQRGYTARSNVRGAWMRERHPAAFTHFFGRIDELVVPNLSRLLSLCREASLPVVHVTFGSARRDRRDLLSYAHRRPPAWARDPRDADAFLVGGPEHRIIEQLTPLPDEFVVNKTSYSAFTTTHIDLLLRSVGATQLVVGGWATDACVALTARDAADRGYQTFLVEDACVAFTPTAHSASIRSFARLFGGAIKNDAVLRAGKSLSTSGASDVHGVEGP